jgi:hypothetical protein
MDRQVKFDWTLVVVIVCAALAGGASPAAERGGRSAPQSGETDSHQDGLPGGGASRNPVSLRISPVPSLADRIPISPVIATMPALPLRPPPVGSKAPGKGGKSAGAALGIDLVRPDDGYINLRRRATRSSPIAAGQTKKLQIAPPVAVKPHPASPAGASAPGNSHHGEWCARSGYWHKRNEQRSCWRRRGRRTGEKSIGDKRLRLSSQILKLWPSSNFSCTG